MRSTLFPILLFAASLTQAADGPSDLDRVKIGATPPSFTLPAADGSRVSLESLKGRNVVLVFYRGYW